MLPPGSSDLVHHSFSKALGPLNRAAEHGIPTICARCRLGISATELQTLFFAELELSVRYLDHVNQFTGLFGLSGRTELQKRFLAVGR